MGNWRLTMPLLSTLAALVIIVHSAEEEMEMEREHRHPLRPRNLDTETDRHEKPWRAVETEPIIQQESKQVDIWDSPPEEAHRRGRPGRKRKRRPMAFNENYEQPPRPHHHEIQYRDNNVQASKMDKPKRRRKRPDMSFIRWNGEPLAERPLRRRNNRRKKVGQQNRPMLSEFNDFDIEFKNFQDIDKDATTVAPEGNATTVAPEENATTVAPEENATTVAPEENATKVAPEQYTTKVAPEENSNLHEEFDKHVTVDEEPKTFESTKKPIRHVRLEKPEEKSYEVTDIKDDTSISEISDEINNSHNKLSASKLSVLNVMYKVQHNTPIDPIKLKELLKRSNGSSLSEILQEHNLSLGDLLNGKANALLASKKGQHLKKNTDETIQGTKSFNTEESTKPNGINSSNLNFNYDTRTSVDDEQQLDDVQIKNKTPKQMLDTTESQSKQQTEIVPGRPKIMRKIPRGPRRKRLRPSNGTHKAPLSRDLIALSTRKFLFPKPRRLNATKGREWKDMLPRMLNSSSTTAPEIDETTEYITTTSADEKTTTQNGLENESTSTDTNAKLEIVTETETTMLIEEPSTTTTTTTTKTLKLMPIIDPTANNGFRRHSYNNRLKRKRLKQLNIVDTSRGNVDLRSVGLVSALEFIERVQEPSSQGKKDLDPELEDFLTTESMITETRSKPNVTNTETSTTLEGQSTNTEKLKLQPIIRPTANSSSRRQPYNNRHQRKRLKQSSIEHSSGGKETLSTGDLSSASEFIERVQEPSLQGHKDMVSELEDFLTTESSYKETMYKPSYYSTNIALIIEAAETTTEIIAKKEIEEILNDTRTSARLSKILMERNMTFEELLEHRERGSSNVHLADIFHNTSREPNPPEPFLAKSLIEPISKETYPLRAILEANLHDQGNKITTTDYNEVSTPFENIPIVMDFGTNVNENGENMGILSLFNKFIQNNTESSTNKNAEENNSLVTVTDNISRYTNDSVRESRTLEEKVTMNTPEMIGWNEIFGFMGRNLVNDSAESLTKEVLEENKKLQLEEDFDGDSVIVLDDLQHLKHTDVIGSTSDEKLEVNIASTEMPIESLIDKIPNHTKSVTVAMASIVGLALILFLLTYAIFKWRQQKNSRNNIENFDDRIPTPVFENRKGHKNNSSSRSISPMLNSNIYTVSTMDSSNGKESPEYMWDSLRKPFQ